MELDPHLAYSIRSRGESRVKGVCLYRLLTELPLLFLSVVLGRRRAGCRGSLRRLWSSWYVSLSAPLSTPWLRATPSASSRRSTRRARRSEGRVNAGLSTSEGSLLLQATTTPFLKSALPWLIPHNYPKQNISSHLVSLLLL